MARTARSALVFGDFFGDNAAGFRTRGISTNGADSVRLLDQAEPAAAPAQSAGCGILVGVCGPVRPAGFRALPQTRAAASGRRRRDAKSVCPGGSIDSWLSVRS